MIDIKKERDLGYLVERLERFKKITSVNDNDVFYASVKEFLNLKAENLRERLKELDSFLFELGELKFNNRLPQPIESDLFSYFVQSMNILADELEDKVFPYHNHVINGIKEVVIIIDHTGKIKTVNKRFYDLFPWYSSDSIKEKFIQNILNYENLIQNLQNEFCITDAEGELILNENETIPVSFSISEVKENKLVEGYIFFISKK